MEKAFEILETREILETLEILETSETTETTETTETSETLEINIICPACNKKQLKIITVSICEAKDTIWYKCFETDKCPLFQYKNK